MCSTHLRFGGLELLCLRAYILNKVVLLAYVVFQNSPQLAGFLDQDITMVVDRACVAFKNGCFTLYIQNRVNQ